MEILQGNYSHIEPSELRRIAFGMMEKYKSLQGKHPRESFKSYSSGENYVELREEMIEELARVFQKMKSQFVIKHPALLGMEDDFRGLAERMVPSTRTLTRILFEAQKSEDSFSFRKTALDACYLFIYHKTRSIYRASFRGNPPIVSEKGFIFDFSNLEFDETLANIIEQNTDPEFIQFIGLFDGVMPLCYGHLLHSEQVKRLFMGAAPEQKEKEILELGPDVFLNLETLNQGINSLNSSAMKLSQGDVKRFVLDLEQGGIIYYHLFSNKYLIGFSLTQFELVTCLEKLERVGKAIITKFQIGGRL